MPFSKEMILGSSGNQGAACYYSYQIEQSCRFDSGSSSSLSRTIGTPTNIDKFTVSTWVKRGILASSGNYKYAGFGVSGDYGSLGFINDTHEIWDYPSSNMNIVTNAGFRDATAFGHFVVAIDTTQSTNSDRVKFYVNGTQITSFSSSTYPSQGTDLGYNKSGNTFYVGSAADTGNSIYQPFDGYLAEFIFVDGTQHAPTQFGETKNGVWIPKDPSGTTFGNNGFHLKFEDASNLGNDSSGNNNDLSASGLGTDHQVLDSPTFTAP